MGRRGVSVGPAWVSLGDAAGASPTTNAAGRGGGGGGGGALGRGARGRRGARGGANGTSRSEFEPGGQSEVGGSVKPVYERSEYAGSAEATRPGGASAGQSTDPSGHSSMAVGPGSDIRLPETSGGHDAGIEGGSDHRRDH